MDERKHHSTAPIPVFGYAPSIRTGDLGTELFITPSTKQMSVHRLPDHQITYSFADDPITRSR
jgi:hypothetical protein